MLSYRVHPTFIDLKLIFILIVNQYFGKRSTKLIEKKKSYLTVYVVQLRVNGSLV